MKDSGFSKLLVELNKGTKSALTKKKIIGYYIGNSVSTIPELSKELNLSIPTVTKVIAEMCDDGILSDKGKLETSGGRYPNQYGLNSDACYFIGVDINRFSVSIGLINFNGEIIREDSEVSYNFENTPESLEILCQLVENFIDSSSVDKSLILNINFNISGRVNPILGYSYSIFNFDNRPLGNILSDRFHCQVMIDNDTRAMTYGEFLNGCVTDEKNIIFLNISWGIAVGIIIDGHIYYGKSGFSGEIGHVKTFDNNIMCHCGKMGCLETEVSGAAMSRILAERIQSGELSILSEYISPEKPITLGAILAAISAEDPLAIDVLDKMAQKLGKYLSGLINILNPEMLIVGGALSEVGDLLLLPLYSGIRKFSLKIVSNDSRVVLSKLKSKAGLVGACLLARSRMFE